MRFVLALAATVLATPPMAQTAQNCAPRVSVVERLDGYYGETMQGGGLQDDATLFEVWVSPEDGTWTILMTDVDGMSCIMAAGSAWTGGNQMSGLTGVRS